MKTVKMVISPAAEKVMGESDSYTESAEIKESWKKIGCRRTEVQTPNTGQCKRKSSKMVARIWARNIAKVKIVFVLIRLNNRKGFLQFSNQNNSKNLWLDLQCLRQSATPKAFLFYVWNWKSLLLYVFLSEQKWDIFRSIKLASNVLLALRNGQILAGITFDLSHWWRWAENNETACLEWKIHVLPLGREIKWHFWGSFPLLKLPLRLQSGNASFPSCWINWLFSDL